MTVKDALVRYRACVLEAQSARRELEQAETTYRDALNAQHTAMERERQARDRLAKAEAALHDAVLGEARAAR